MSGRDGNRIEKNFGGDYVKLLLNPTLLECLSHFKTFTNSLNHCTFLSFPRSSSTVTLAHPPTRSSLKITNRSFQYAAPCLWNELPTDLREPRQTQSPSLSPLTHGSSSSSSSPSSDDDLHDHHLHLLLLVQSFTLNLRLRLFGKSFPP